jgi:ubiquinone/menaquinone biosynthesis C-methylase UbiE
MGCRRSQDNDVVADPREEIQMSIDLPAGEQAAAAPHRATWAMGDYARIAEEVMAPIGPLLVAATGIGPGDRVLDVAAGSGNVSIPAAKAGASVVASDLTPELLQRARMRAAQQRLALECREANAEALPFADGEFDAVLSAIGVMFAPRHQRAADQLVRVCRSGGTLGVVSWTPEGFFGQMLATISPYRPTLQQGDPPAALWGREDYVAGLLGDRVADLSARRGMLTVDRFDSAEAVHEYFKHHYGPTIEAYRHIADDPGLVGSLDAELVGLAQSYLANGTMQWEYLLVTATKR